MRNSSNPQNGVGSDFKLFKPSPTLTCEIDSHQAGWSARGGAKESAGNSPPLAQHKRQPRCAHSCRFVPWPDFIPQGDGSTPLHTAARFDSKDVAQLLLTAGANPNAVNAVSCPTPVCALMIQRGNTPLHVAVENRAKEVTNVLVRSGADINARGEVSS